MARIILIAFDGAQTLDITGPGEVFACANRALGRKAYQVLVAARRASIVCSAGISLGATRLATLSPRASDTVLVVGGEDGPIRSVLRDKALLAWLSRAGELARRVGSVCSGAFVLAHTGLLDGKRAATHWSACALLARFRPQVTVDTEAIFVREGKCWTSAGVTTGIDMALAMVEEDHGRAVATEIAARLVLYARRPGFQSQFSAPLRAQLHEANPLGPVVEWARAHPRQLTPDGLAQRAGLAPRTFHRRCQEHLGTSPAKLIERLRVEQARALLELSQLNSKQVADRCGFTDATHMGRAFRRVLGIKAQEYRALHGARRPLS